MLIRTMKLVGAVVKYVAISCLVVYIPVSNFAMEVSVVLARSAWIPVATAERLRNHFLVVIAETKRPV